MRSPLRTMAATVLVLEAMVVFFAALVAKDLSGLGVARAVGGGAALAVLGVLVAGTLRFRVGYGIGWAYQLVLILTGLVVPMMFGIGVLFAALWAAALFVGTKVERERAFVARRLAEREAATGSGDATG